MIFVTVGTHEAPFDRLVLAAEAFASRHDEPVVVQRGTSRVAAPHCTVHDFLAPHDVDHLVGLARVVVTHGGAATIDQVLHAGRVPIVVPRRASYGEHVDDHQVQLLRRFGDRVHVLDDPFELPAAIARHAELEAAVLARGLRLDDELARADAFGRVVEDAVGGGRPTWRERWRRVRALLAP